MTANTEIRKAGVTRDNDKRPRPLADSWRKQKDLPIVFKVVAWLGILPPNPTESKIPQLDDKVPAYTELKQCLHLLPWALAPFVARSIYVQTTGQTLNPWAQWFAMFLYTLVFGGHFVNRMNGLALKYGYFDPGTYRDTVPYSQVSKVLTELFAGMTLRPALAVFFAYDREATPKLTPWFPIQLFIFTVIEDFYYYWLHRMCHEFDSTWRLHRLHHTTKHPTSLFLGYADEIQEVFDVALVPLMAWLTFPLDFDTFSVWIIIHISIQLHGHSGVRLHYGTILTGPFLRPLGLDLVLEDHDLHHRFGWKESCNYGKQSRVWDSLFGTHGERIEGRADNIDWVNTV